MDNTDAQNLTLIGTTLEITNGTSADLSSLQDGTGTDDQNISGSGLSGTTITIGIEGGTDETVDLSSLQADGSETKINAGTNITITGTGISGDSYIINSTGYYLGQEKDGGIIFYIYRDSDGQEHGLIVAKTETTAQWQSAQSETLATRSWDGVYNTNLMTNSPARTDIEDLGTGWYLPSIDELILLWHNRFHVNKAMYAGEHTFLPVSSQHYWSSTEFIEAIAWSFDFFESIQGMSNKGTENRVRAVRAF